MTKSKIISSKKVFKSKYYWIDQEEIKRDGKIFRKDILKRTPTVIVLPINEKDEIFLVSQFRDSMQERLTEVVAGHIEKGQSPLDAAKVELKEETGLTAKTWKRLGIFYISANMEAVVHVFFATDLTIGTQMLEEDEEIELIKTPFEKALQMIDEGEIRVATNIAALLLLDRWRKEANQ